MMSPLVHTSKPLPSRTAFAMPSGMEMMYTSSVVHSPSEMDTGSLSITRSTTDWSRKKLSPKSKRR